MRKNYLKAVSWGVVGALKWGRDYGTKTHIYDADVEDWPGYGQTICGRDFRTSSELDKLRRQVHGGPSFDGAYLVDIEDTLDHVDCKSCLRIITARGQTDEKNSNEI